LASLDGVSSIEMRLDEPLVGTPLGGAGASRFHELDLADFLVPYIDGQVERSVGHRERAIAINPVHARAIETPGEVKALRDSDDED
jgi:hypothetical protein